MMLNPIIHIQHPTVKLVCLKEYQVLSKQEKRPTFKSSIEDHYTYLLQNNFLHAFSCNEKEAQIFKSDLCRVGSGWFISTIIVLKADMTLSLLAYRYAYTILIV